MTTTDSFDLDQLVRSNIRRLKPYKSARDSFEEGLLLDANENSLGAPYPDGAELHRYPSPHHHKLRSRIAKWRGVEAKHVFTGVGSDESIDLLFRIFCTPGTDRVLITPPTYGMYEVSANIHDIAIDSVLLEPEQFQPSVEKVLQAVRPETKLLFLCSPNNPTGTVFDRSSIQRLIEEFPGIVVVDEAYIDFSGEESWAPEVRNYPNLVVLQTLSKSFGLAGIRLGIAIGPPSVIRYFMKVKPPYNINVLSYQHALRAFEHIPAMEDNIKRIIQERDRLGRALEKLSIVKRIYPSKANFLLVKVNNARLLYEQLSEKGIIIRYRGDEPHCDNCLRITVGSQSENDQLVTAIKQMNHEHLD